ncbi:ferric reductase NAD binding domain-containing protein [Irpex lacteus]|nr:ferric reductase NAD binding domain-containing protein [Irpex lacteus]
MASPLILEATPSKADRLLKATQQRKYVKDLWILLGSILLSSRHPRPPPSLLPVFSAKRINASADPATPSTPSEKVDPEALNKTGNGKASFRRLPLPSFPPSVCGFPFEHSGWSWCENECSRVVVCLWYIAIMLVLCFIDTEGLNKYFWQDRAAHLASCQLPLIVAWLARTTSSHSSLVCHMRSEHTSPRVCTDMSPFLWIHAITRGASGLPEKFDFSHGWIRWGAVGLVAFTLTTIYLCDRSATSLRVLLDLAHILVALFIIGGYLHAREVDFGITFGLRSSSGLSIAFCVGSGGFTGRLREHAKNGKTATVPAFVDGPYGCPPDLTRYSTSILVAGGSGVSYTLPLLLNLVSKARAGTSAVRRVIFVWSVRDADHIKWISKVLTEALVAAQPTNLHVEARLYITGPSAPTFESREAVFDSDTSESPTPANPSSEKDVKLPLYHSLQIMHGRPSIRKILQEEITSAQGPVSVDVAGPSGLSQSVAKALASNLTSPLSVLRGTPSVTLHTETFGMTK